MGCPWLPDRGPFQIETREKKQPPHIQARVASNVPSRASSLRLQAVSLKFLTKGEHFQVEV
jgi:hypothetical protein